MRFPSLSDRVQGPRDRREGRRRQSLKTILKYDSRLGPPCISYTHGRHLPRTWGTAVHLLHRPFHCLHTSGQTTEAAGVLVDDSVRFPVTRRAGPTPRRTTWTASKRVSSTTAAAIRLRPADHVNISGPVRWCGHGAGRSHGCRAGTTTAVPTGQQQALWQVAGSPAGDRRDSAPGADRGAMARPLMPASLPGAGPTASSPWVRDTLPAGLRCGMSGCDTGGGDDGVQQHGMDRSLLEPAGEC